MTRPGRARRLAVEMPATLAALVVACVVEVGLRATKLQRLARFLGTPLALGDTSPGSTAARRAALPASATRQVSATRRVLRHWPFGDTCLRQALISGQRLRRLGPELHVGVAKIDGEIRAHAWLEIDGAILDPRYAATSYQTLAQPPGG
ncbi:MAG: lasso peptide biosynthesis B2 protein, partial [Propionibacterium sp.]|nr:lasso peptide biosynthesis B2 protein [Propionibacterium sp.]